jgi:hypothetical protein
MNLNLFLRPQNLLVAIKQALQRLAEMSGKAVEVFLGDIFNNIKTHFYKDLGFIFSKLSFE